MRLVINGVDFDLLIEQARARVLSNLYRRIAAAHAEGRPHPGRSAGQLWRYMKVREGLPVTPDKRTKGSP